VRWFDHVGFSEFKAVDTMMEIDDDDEEKVAFVINSHGILLRTRFYLF